MCRIGAIKSAYPLSPGVAIDMMLPQQEGYDNSGFALVMQDLEGAFAHYKDKPLLSMACTAEGAQLVDAYMQKAGFVQAAQWSPAFDREAGARIKTMPRYIFRNYDYPEIYHYRTQKEREELCLDTRLTLRELLAAGKNGFVYSFWPDVLTIKEIGDPSDVAAFFRLREDGRLLARNLVVQCRQNTNYDIVRYAAHPFFLQGYTLCANGENTFFTRNREFQKSLHRGYVGFESDSQCLLYTLHYVLRELAWPPSYYKHVITPLPPREVADRPDRQVLELIRESLAHLESNGPCSLIGLLPDGQLFTCCDAKKLRPVVMGRDQNMVVVTSEVCGLNAVLPDRDPAADIYPDERTFLVVDNNLEAKQWRQ